MPRVLLYNYNILILKKRYYKKNLSYLKYQNKKLGGILIFLVTSAAASANA
jgi:hypothetical protein